MLAQEWFYGLMTHPDMSIKVERQLHDMRILVRIVGVRSTEQFVWHLLPQHHSISCNIKYSNHSNCCRSPGYSCFESEAVLPVPFSPRNDVRPANDLITGTWQIFPSHLLADARLSASALYPAPPQYRHFR